MIAWAHPNPPRRSSDVRDRCSRDRRTGAAANAFGVKTAAAAAGPSVATTSPRSGRPDALIPATRPLAVNPPGMSGTSLDGREQVGEQRGDGRPQRRHGASGSCSEAGRLGQAVHEVERLDGLAGGALHEVVLDAEDEDRARSARRGGRGSRTSLLPVTCFVAGGVGTTVTNGSSA